MSEREDWVNTGQRCGACAENDTGHEMCNHVRGGKTAQDRKSGAWGNRFENRAARVAWGAESKPTNATFPRHSCNGKKNRFHV